MVSERQTLFFGARERRKGSFYVPFIWSEESFVFYLNVRNVLNAFLEYTYFYISQNITKCYYIEIV